MKAGIWVLMVHLECFTGTLSLKSKTALGTNATQLALSTEEVILQHDAVSLPKDQYCTNSYQPSLGKPIPPLTKISR